MTRAAAHIGTSGWNYKDWKGRFYPKGLGASNWLAHYASQFCTVELNGSFYRVPKPEHVERWAQVAPSGFLFAVKMWRGVTHYRRLRETGTLLERFFEAADRFPASHRGPLLIQLPPRQKADAARLDAFLRDLRETSSGRWKVSVEFRDSSWLTPEVYKVLDRRGAAVCLHDLAGRGDTGEPNDARFVYIRRHGSSEKRYAGSYSPAQIEHDAVQVRSWLREGKSVFVYYNNDVAGHAVENARSLHKAVDQG